MEEQKERLLMYVTAVIVYMYILYISYRANGEPVGRQGGREIQTAILDGDSRINNGDIETPLRQYN
jgi:hypothetical protein